MANTFTQLSYHCVFSTKNRIPLISHSIEESCWSIIVKTAQTHGIYVRRIGGMPDHIHLLIDIPKTLAVAEAVKRIKGGSSKAISQSGLIKGEFTWQDGYGAFTVSASTTASVVKYIADQKAHHQTMSFEDEYKALLEKHGIDYDPKFLLG